MHGLLAEARAIALKLGRGARRPRDRMARLNLTLTPEAADFISAAVRHIGDAELLLHASRGHASPDQAFHLAGFAPECIRKGILSVRWLDKAIGHGADASSAELLDLAVAIDPIAHRYDALCQRGSSTAFDAWKIDVRYERTGTRSRAEAEALCAEARQAVDAVVLALWADGRLPDGEDLW